MEAYTTYTSGAPSPVRIAARPDSVFAALAVAYQEVGIAVGTSDPNSRTAGNTQVRATRRLGRTSLSTYLDCGHTPAGNAAADSRPIRLSVLSTAEPAGEGSQLSTVIQAFQISESGETLPCFTTGVLEAAIATAVQRKLGR